MGDIRSSQKDKSKKAKGLSTFGGVFTPSILTILGVIMYLRFGWVVGNVGLLGTLLIVTLSTLITFFTALSIASIATDQKVKTGGAYFMISRSLGIETGGAVGIPLFIAQALSVSLYTLGFAESLSLVFPRLDETMVGMAVTVFVGLVAMFSTKAAIRSQFVILSAIAISLISLIFGKSLDATEIEVWGASSENSVGFWVVFAVFFPAVTGIMAGVNMSGDLKNPSKSIPRGTFWAIGVGYLVYMLLPILLASRADASTLIDDPLIMRKIAFWGDAILLGIWGATLSSAIGSIMGAPRVLQALSNDKVLPPFLKWLGKGHGKENIPKWGTLFTMILALIAVYFGNLDMIAPILTMFFLTTYGVLNISAGLERFLGSPSFRPSFKVHWIFSLLGAIGCIGVMFLINSVATIIAIIIVSFIYVWLMRRGLRTAWGDVRGGVWMALTRAALSRIDATPDVKNWRPNILILSGAPTKRWHLIDIANSITQGKALMTVSTILDEKMVSTERVQSIENNIREFLHKEKVRGLVRVISASDPFSGGKKLVDAYGLGALVPNTVLLGDTRESGNRDKYCDMVSHFYNSRRNVLIVRDDEKKGYGKREQIDVWWGGIKGNGGLMMVLAYLISNSRDWRNARVRIKMVVDSLDAARDAQENLDSIIPEMRIKFERHVIVSNGRPFEQILQDESGKSDLVLLGLAKPKDDFPSYYKGLSEKTKNLPSTIFVLASQKLPFEEVLS